MSEKEIKIGDEVWYGADLGRVVGVEGDKLRVVFDQDPDGAPPKEGVYVASNLELIEG